jgi:hypothetical protein
LYETPLQNFWLKFVNIVVIGSSKFPNDITKPFTSIVSQLHAEAVTILNAFVGNKIHSLQQKSNSTQLRESDLRIYWCNYTC